MSFLRRLTFSKPSSAAQINEVKPEITLLIHVPAYGALWMNPPVTDELSESLRQTGIAGPSQTDVTLHGELEVIVPSNWGRKRCKRIEVGVRADLRLNMGKGREVEEDTQFHRKVEIVDDDGGVWLEPGPQKFTFTILIPNNLAVHDWHVNARLNHWVYAEVEGLEPPEESKAGSSTRSRSTSGGSRRSPAPTSIDGVFRNASPERNDTIFEDMAMPSSGSMPQTPAYEDVEDSWIVGNVRARRVLYPIYNPNESGGITELSESQKGWQDGIGEYEFKMTSDVWTVCAFLNLKANFYSMSPRTTLFSLRVLLAQTHTITSPRDGKTIKSVRHFTIIEHGVRPPREHVHPAKHIAALWRGVGAGGTDTGEWEATLQGRLPDDDNGRPTTLPIISTPIQVAHQLIVELLFSVYGEDQEGRVMRPPGDGGLRVMRAKKTTVIPSCGFTIRNVKLPTCIVSIEVVLMIDQESLTPGQIPCPHHRIPRNELTKGWEIEDDAMTKRKELCPQCAVLAWPDGGPGWRSCACGLTMEQSAERARRRLEDAEWQEDRGRKRGED